MLRGLPVLLVLIGGCEVPPVGEHIAEVPFLIVEIEGVDRMSQGDTLQVTIRSQEAYDAFLETHYFEPLNAYCNEHFAAERERLRQKDPGLSEAELQRRVNAACIASTPDLEGLNTAPPPEIDFEQFTLLGQDAHAGGCDAPDYRVLLVRNEPDGSYTFDVRVTEFGSCALEHYRVVLVQTPRIPESRSVIFEKAYQTQRR